MANIHVVLIDDPHIKPPEILAFTTYRDALRMARAKAQELSETYGEPIIEKDVQAVDVHETEHTDDAVMDDIDDDEDGYIDIIASFSIGEDTGVHIWISCTTIDDDTCIRT